MGERTDQPYPAEPVLQGAHLVCRTHQKGIRSNTYDIIPPREEWEVLEGCHREVPVYSTIDKSNICA